MSRAHRALAMLALSLLLVVATTAVAAAAPVVVQDQSDRLLAGIEAGRAERAQAAAELARSMERDFTPVAGVDGVIAQPGPRIEVPVAGRDVNVTATLLLGLVGGLAGGIAVMAGWPAVVRRRPHRAASAV